MSSDQSTPMPVNIQASPIKASDNSWLEFQLKQKQESINRLEDVAKFLSGLSSLSLSILVAVNGESIRILAKQFAFSNTGPALKSGIVCWLLSVVLSLAVVFPFPYKYNSNSADSIKSTYNKIGIIKYSLLILAAILFLIGICRITYLYLFISL